MYFFWSAQDFDGNKMINEYVRQYKIGTGSYGKVVSASLKNSAVFLLNWACSPERIETVSMESWWHIQNILFQWKIICAPI